MTTLQYNKLHFTSYWIFLINIISTKQRYNIGGVNPVFPDPFTTKQENVTHNLHAGWPLPKATDTSSQTNPRMFRTPIKESTHDMQTKYHSSSPIKLQSSLRKFTWNILTVPQCCLDHGNARYPFKMPFHPSKHPYRLRELGCHQESWDRHPKQDEANIFKWRCCP